MNKTIIKLSAEINSQEIELKLRTVLDIAVKEGMTLVRTGRNLSCVTEEMRTAKDKWILQRCKKVKYLPSKAAVLEELFFKVKTK